jgi:prepilin-type N-terminal cleavage/methylation domain-containing protein
MSKFGLKLRKREAGFTLIEIMIVVLIIAILLSIAIPNFLRARETSRAKSCTANLRQIETAKEQWAMDTKAAASATPTAADLVDEYMKGTPDTLPECPSGGAYTIGDMQTRPVCAKGAQSAGDYDDHVLK